MRLSFEHLLKSSLLFIRIHVLHVSRHRFILYNIRDWLGGILVYYNTFPYYAYPTYYPVQAMAPTPLPRQQAMPTNETNRSSYPPVNTEKLGNSVRGMRKMVPQVQLLFDKISTSDQFARDLKTAAQRSDKATVNRLIRSVGVTNEFEIKYTPDSIQIKLIEKNCCFFTVVLDW